MRQFCQTEVVSALTLAFTVTGGLTAEEEMYLRGLLSRVTQPWSTAFAEIMQSIMPSNAVELVVRRWVKGELQVLLLQRKYSDDDPWNGQWHCPGTIIRGDDGKEAKEETARTGTKVRARDIALRRLVECEIGALLKRSFFAYEDEISEFGPRILVIQWIYVGLVEEDAEVNGTWFDIDALPPNIMAEHVPMIRRAALATDR
jgi:hypothetical protein